MRTPNVDAGDAADEVVQAEVPCRVNACHLYRQNWIETQIDCFLHHEVHIAIVDKLTWSYPVGC